VRRRSQNEKTKRKNYETKTLQDEQRTSQLHAIHRRHAADGTKVTAPADHHRGGGTRRRGTWNVGSYTRRKVCAPLARNLKIGFNGRFCCVLIAVFYISTVCITCKKSVCLNTWVFGGEFWWSLREGHAARVIHRTSRYDHATSLLKELHWLRVPERIEINSSSVHSCTAGRPTSLSDSLQRVMDVKSLGRLRSSSSSTLVVPVTRRATLGDGRPDMERSRPTRLYHSSDSRLIIHSALRRRLDLSSRTFGGTAAAAPPPFRPSDPALCGSRPL